MATLNLSTNGTSISKSYQSVVSSPAPTGPAAASPTYGQWAIYSVSTPLVSAFQQDAGGKESVLKVQSTGEGELVDLIDEFSDGRVQFAFVKVKDLNTALPKLVLIGWCGEGVPERTKGYFTSHQAAVVKVLHGYHVQVTARSDRDLSPEGIIQKVADASGSKYTAGTPLPNAEPVHAATSRPAFLPTQSSTGRSTFNPLSKSARAGFDQQGKVDEDGWGEDAPPVTRTQLEKVQPAYEPTKINMRELSSQAQTPSQSTDDSAKDLESSDVVKGAYRPVGKVDIAAIRREAQASGTAPDDRLSVVKGSYEPVGGVDIAAIRNRAQQPSSHLQSLSSSTPSVSPGSIALGVREKGPTIEPSAALTASERLTTLPKPKISNKFGSGTGAFAGTKAPTPGSFGLENKVSPTAPPISASRTFADEGGKTPAQLWAEKKARQGGPPGSQQRPSAATSSSLRSPLASQTSGGGEWKSGYSGKTWAPVQTTKEGQANASIDGQSPRGQEEQEEQQTKPEPSSGEIHTIREKFQNASPMGISATERRAPSPPALNTSNKPNASTDMPIHGLSKQGTGSREEYLRLKVPTPPPQPRSPTPQSSEEDAGSPIKVAMPVSRNLPKMEDAHKGQFSPPSPLPVPSMAREVSRQEDTEGDEPKVHDTARTVASTLASTNFGHDAGTPPEVFEGGKRALVQYDYEKAEDNELELREGEYVTNIQMVDEDWWMGQNSRGESGLFPSNYVELVEGEKPGIPSEEQPIVHGSVTEAAPHAGQTGRSSGTTATALYDYEAAEDNELTFPEGAKITSVEFPDEDWWSGEYGGHSGLFPANYVQLNE